MTKPRRRRRATVPILASVAMLAAACSSGPDAPTADDPVTITFSSYTYQTDGAAGDGTQALLDRFAQLHPEIEVETQAVPTADVLSKARTDTAAGNPPDVVQLGYSKLGEAFGVLPLAELDELAGDDWEEHVEGLNEALLETGTDEGHVRALPFTVSTPVMFLNADLFDDVGLDPEDPPTSIDEVREAAEAITGDGTFGAYFAVADPGKSDYLTQSVVNSAGGAVVDGDEVLVDSPESVRALGDLQELTEAGLQPDIGVEDAIAAFSSGRIGMFVISTAVAGTLQAAAEDSFELRTAPFPTFGDGPAAPTVSGAGLVVISDDEARQQAAWTFVEFMTSAEAGEMVTEQIGYLPMRDELTAQGGPLSDYLEANPLLVPAVEQLDEVVPYRFFGGRRPNEAVVLLQDDAVEPIVLRGADPEQTLGEVAGRIEELADQ